MKIGNLQMIVFDLFGVLVSEGHLISNVLMKLLPAGTDRQRVKALYNAYNLGDIEEAGFWSALGLNGYDSIRRQFLQSFTLDTDYTAVIDALKAQYRLAILSNLPPDWADALTRRFQFEQTFAPCFFSGHRRCKKPQIEIYQQLLAQTALPAQRMLFIDDRLENLQTAHELGMITVYYQRESEDHGYRADYRINRLDQLLNLLKT